MHLDRILPHFAIPVGALTNTAFAGAPTGIFGCAHSSSNAVIQLTEGAVKVTDAVTGELLHYAGTLSRTVVENGKTFLIFGDRAVFPHGSVREEIRVGYSLKADGTLLGLSVEERAGYLGGKAKTFKPAFFACGSQTIERYESEPISKFDSVLDRFRSGNRRFSVPGTEYTFTVDGDDIKAVNGKMERAIDSRTQVIRQTFKEYPNGAVSFVVGEYIPNQGWREEAEVFLKVSETGELEYFRMNERRFQIGSRAIGGFKSSPRVEGGNARFADGGCKFVLQHI